MIHTRLSIKNGDRHLRFITTILLILILALSLSARTPLITDHPSTRAIIDDPPCRDYATHDINLLGLTLTNMGRLGTGYDHHIIPDTVPSCAYPYPDSNEYLYAGGLWIGGIVGEDTLVSVAADGWHYVMEMWPDPCPGGEIGEETTISDQDITAVFTDTLTDPAYVLDDPWNGRPHIPLNIEITITSRAWSDIPFEDFIILDYSIKNIGETILDSTYIGIYIDGDVHEKNDWTGALDDITGFLPVRETQYSQCYFEDTFNMAWLADNDGINIYNECDLTAVTGIYVIRTPSDSMTHNFNYWFSNGNPNLDWGPRQQGTETDPFRDFGGILGTPEGDENKYYVMSHAEQDYDQLFAAVDHTGEGWLPPHFSLAENIADGYDTRYLLSFGPFRIQSGETLPLVLAYVAGEDFHGDCSAFESLFDPYAPDAFYDQLNFEHLTRNALLARWTYDNPGVDTDGDGYHGKYRLCVHDSALVYDTIQFDPLITDTVWVYTDIDTIFYEGDGVPDWNPVSGCGDVDLNGSINLLDINELIYYLYVDEIPPPGRIMADVDNSGTVNLLDIVYLIQYLYYNGPAPNC